MGKEGRRERERDVCEITRAKVSTRNKCFPLDFTSCCWDKRRIPETEGNEAEKGSNVIALSNELDGTFETPKPPIAVNCRTRLQATAAILRFRWEKKQTTPKIAAQNFQARNLNPSQQVNYQTKNKTTILASPAEHLVFYPSLSMCFFFLGNQKGDGNGKGKLLLKQTKIIKDNWPGEVWNGRLP